MRVHVCMNVWVGLHMCACVHLCVCMCVCVCVYQCQQPRCGCKRLQLGQDVLLLVKLRGWPAVCLSFWLGARHAGVPAPPRWADALPNSRAVPPPQQTGSHPPHQACRLRRCVMCSPQRARQGGGREKRVRSDAHAAGVQRGRAGQQAIRTPMLVADTASPVRWRWWSQMAMQKRLMRAGWP